MTKAIAKPEASTHARRKNAGMQQLRHSGVCNRARDPIRATVGAGVAGNSKPEAAGQARALRAALADAGLAPSEIGYVNAHDTATTAGDAAEAASLAEVFGACGVPVSSTKAIHGYLLGAGGAVELLAVLRSLACGRLPPAHIAAADASFAIGLVTTASRAAPALRHAFSNSFAFGGTNAVLVALRLS